MGKFGKRITAVLMSALMTVSCFGTAFAEEAEEKNSFGYTAFAAVSEATGDDGYASGDDGKATEDDGKATEDDGKATGDDAEEYDVTVTIIGGDESGIELSIESGKYSGSVDFTAESEKAAKLFFTTDDGETYEALAAEATDDENVYSFAIDVDQDLEIIAVLSGDFTGDGKVNSTDAKQVQRADAEVITASAFQALASDVNGDGKFNSTDAKQIQRADAEVTTLGW